MAELNDKNLDSVIGGNGLEYGPDGKLIYDFDPTEYHAIPVYYPDPTAPTADGRIRDIDLAEVDGGIVQNISTTTTFSKENQLLGDYGRTWNLSKEKDS